MKNHIVIDISGKNPYSEFSFSSNRPKCSQPIKLLDSLKYNILYNQFGGFFKFFKVWDEVDFFCVEKHQKFRQVGTSYVRYKASLT